MAALRRRVDALAVRLPEGGLQAFRRCVALFAVSCLIVAGFPAAASAHEPAPESYTERGDTIIGYKDGDRIEPFTETYIDKVTVRLPKYKKVRVAPFNKTVPVYENRLTVKCVLVPGISKRICTPTTVRVQTGTKTVPAYNYENVRDGWGEPFEVPVTKTRPVYNYEQIPIYDILTKYRCYPGHSLEGGKCVHSTTTTRPEINIPPKGVTCPAGYEYGTGSLGSSPPYAAPSGKFWKSVKASSPVFPIHTCWQLQSGGCPAGTIMAMARYSTTPNRLLIGYEEGHLPEAPNDKIWTHAVANADYACYVLKDKISILDSLTNAFKQAWEDGKPILQAVVEGFDDYLCQDYLWTGGLTAGAALTSEGARRVSNARLAAQAAGVTRYATITGVAILGACIAIDATNIADPDDDNDSNTETEDDGGNEDQDDDSDTETEDTSTPDPEPTVQPTAEPTVQPTAEPTVQPTAEPTAEPVLTGEAAWLAALLQFRLGKITYAVLMVHKVAYQACIAAGNCN